MSGIDRGVVRHCKLGEEPSGVDVARREEIPDAVVQMGGPPNRIDVLNTIGGVVGRYKDLADVEEFETSETYRK